MPSVSEKQARTMRAAAHDPKFAAKLDIPQDVAREYVAADSARSSGAKRGWKGRRKKYAGAYDHHK